MLKKYSFLFLFVLILLALSCASAQTITVYQQNKPTSTRGLSVVDDSIAWMSSNHGCIAISRNGGKSWDYKQVKGFEKSDFRGIEAFSDKEAVIISSGSPALLLKTIDGGETWQTKYSTVDTSYFFDAIAFDSPLHGYVMGDPINNKFLLLETDNGGETWRQVKDEPYAIPGEAAFAASGTCLRVANDTIFIVTGGKASRLLTYTKNDSWRYSDLPFSHQKTSEGAFSLAMNNNAKIFVGGDYANDKHADSVAFVISNKKNADKFSVPTPGPDGFQSCVEHISDDIFIATGTSGSNITINGGVSWTKIDSTSFNVCRKAKHGNLVLFAGDKGKTGIFKL